MSARRNRRRPSAKESVIMSMIDRAGEMCGFHLVKQSAGQLKLGTVYVTLGRMTSKNYLESRQVKDAGQTLRLYRLTEHGARVRRAADGCDASQERAA